MLDQQLEAATAKETEMIRKLAARLPRESVARKCAEALLGGSPIDPDWPAQLCAMLPPKRTPDDPEPLVAAWCLGRVPLSDLDCRSTVLAISSMVDVRQNASRRPTPRLAAQVALAVISYLAILNVAWHSGIPYLSSPFLPLVLSPLAYGFGLLIQKCRIRELATGAQSLGLIADPRAIGPLDLFRHCGASVREPAQTSLDSCINAIRASHYGNLPPEVIPVLCKLLKTAGPDRKLAILQALAYAGDGRAVEAVRPLTEDPLSDRIRDLALRVLPILEARKVQETAAATLLRPSSLQDEPSTVLLRPASGVASVPDEQLLRPAAPSEEVHVYTNR